MPFIPAVDGIKVMMEFVSAQGNRAMNIFWVRDEGGVASIARLTELHGIIHAWANAEWDVVAADAWEFDRLVTQDWNVENSWVVQTLPSVAGARTSEALPATSTMALSLRTGLAGRSFRGRLYHVGLTEDQTEGDFIDPVKATEIVAAYDQLRLDLQADDFTWVVASFVTDGAPRAAAVLSNVINILMTNTALDTMRSRHAN